LHHLRTLEQFKTDSKMPLSSLFQKLATPPNGKPQRCLIKLYLNFSKNRRALTLDDPAKNLKEKASIKFSSL
jgi:hypothetical protein